jgi:hypothetical protein
MRSLWHTIHPPTLQCVRATPTKLIAPTAHTQVLLFILNEQDLLASLSSPPERLLRRYARAIIERNFIEIVSLEAFLWLVFN